MKKSSRPPERPHPPQKPPLAEQRLLALGKLVTFMNEWMAHAPLLTPIVKPAPPQVPDARQFAHEVAHSATMIAHAAARLGTGGDDQGDATVLWQQTLQQIQRVQQLHGLHEMPFQKKATPPGAA